MWAWVALAIFIVFIIILYLLSPLISPVPMKLQDAHILITGGSSGIGKALAVQAVQQGARVTLIARDKVKLEQAKTEVEAYVTSQGKEQRVHIISVDLSKDYQAVEAAVQDAEQVLGAVDVLINCAGTAATGRFEDIPATDFKKMIDINYMSAVHATRALIPSLKFRGQGRIVFVSSQAGQIGLFGMSAYSASKFALRGLAEALQMEVKPYNIYVTLAFPPDTDTPGFQEEQKTKGYLKGKVFITKSNTPDNLKAAIHQEIVAVLQNMPLETKLISETSGIFSPENVATIILKDTVRGRFFSSVGLDGMMLSSLTCGFSPVISLMEATQQVVTVGIFRIISLFYLMHFDRIVQRCKQQRDSQKENKKVS